MTDLDDFRRWLAESHGLMVCLMNQHLSEGNVKQATVAHGQIRAYMLALQKIETIQEGSEEFGTDMKEEYIQVSEAHFKAEKAAKDREEVNIRGMQ